jgi:thiosulfate/3-mercaptopyruvate sulfurtransferase
MTEAFRQTAAPKMLISTSELRERLTDPQLRVFDCSTYLLRDPVTTFREVTGEADWRKEHIPGAGFLDIPNVLSDRSSGLRLTMLPTDQFAARMASHGVCDDSTVVLYSAGQVMWATRVWWMLHAIGFDRAMVLDGGYQKWKREGGPVDSQPTPYPPGHLTVRPRARSFADKREVLAAIDTGDGTIINALPPDQHRGETDINHGRLGRIKSSVNVNAFDLLDQTTGTFKALDSIAALFESADVQRTRRAICYCGGGISATGNAFALLMLGHKDVAVYDGSLNEWARDPSLPMETGS